VLLVEAGPDLRADLPGEFRDGWRLPRGFDWGYASEPNTPGVAENLRRGKLLGGTSWVTRFALRGSRADYDEWAGLGNAGGVSPTCCRTSGGLRPTRISAISLGTATVAPCRSAGIPAWSSIEAGWVVLCAGTYGSPPILMRSGIGPAAHLRSHEIPVRLDLPGVGANLADHAGVDIDCGYRGPARSAPLFHLLATFHSSATPSDEAPDLMLWLSDPRGDPPVFEIDVGLLRPRSRGTVRLRSADPAEPPRIELPGLRDPSDAERLAEAYLRGLAFTHIPVVMIAERLSEQLAPVV
jgi:choline dehydrogenase-like flavoprotein